MLNQGTCSTCRYSFPVDKTEKTEKERPHCRRYPPTAVAIVMPRQASPLQPNVLVPSEEHRAIFPMVMPDWWCGEYAARIVS